VALVLATPLLALATARNLERLGIAQKALQALPLAQRLEGLRAATGRLITPIRKRYGTPLVPTLDLATVDASGLAGGATVSWDGGPATLVQDYLVTFAASGATYTLTTNAGAYGATPSASKAWTGSITIDGYTLTLTGTISTGDAIGWSTTMVQDPGIALSVAQIAAFLLLHNRGVDAKTEADLKPAYEGAMAWAAELGVPGTGELDPSVDRTPGLSEYGPLGAGQSTPYAWLDDPSRG